MEEEIFVVCTRSTDGFDGAPMQPSYIALGLVARVNAVEDDKGIFEGECNIKLKGEAKPFALTTLRRVATCSSIA